MNLDRSVLQKGVPEGSLQYFALLYSPPEKKTLLEAIFALAAEFEESATEPSEDQVAFMRFNWWRDEIGLLLEGEPRHPLTRFLQTAASWHEADAELLEEMIRGAESRRRQSPCMNEDETRQHCFRTYGAAQALTARKLLDANEALDLDRERLPIMVGQTMGAVEILRHFKRDLSRGNVYLSRTLLAEHGLDVLQLSSKGAAASVAAMLRQASERASAHGMLVESEWKARPQPKLLSLMVLNSLYSHLAATLRKKVTAIIAGEQIDLRTLAKAWYSWRAALRFAATEQH